MIALISPAKSMNYDNRCSSKKITSPRFVADADKLAGKLAGMSVKKIGALMHLSPALSDLNYHRYQQWDVAEKRPALSVFTGDVYRGLDAASFSADDYAFAQDRLRILSGLYGLLRPLDEMKPYRLEMGTSWGVTPKTTNLYRYWGNRVAELIENDLNEQDDDVVVNLASNEYAKVANLGTLKATVYNFHFRDKKNGEYKAIMTYAKIARGLMARFMVKERIKHVDEAKAFSYEGYVFNPRLSADREWVFTRG